MAPSLAYVRQTAPGDQKAVLAICAVAQGPIRGRGPRRRVSPGRAVRRDAVGGGLRRRRGRRGP
eukprot:8134393-Lingulodinium_polyedra.AAC.1